VESSGWTSAFVQQDPETEPSLFAGTFGTGSPCAPQHDIAESSCWPQHDAVAPCGSGAPFAQQHDDVPGPASESLVLPQRPAVPDLVQQHSPSQQQPLCLNAEPKQNGLTRPLGHRQVKWGVPATSVIAAVSQTRKVRDVLRSQRINSPAEILPGSPLRVKVVISQKVDDLRPLALGIDHFQRLPPDGRDSLVARGREPGPGFPRLARDAREHLPHADLLGPLGPPPHRRWRWAVLSPPTRSRWPSIGSLRIVPTAAYLLAAPAEPDEASQVAFERAAAGEQITAKEAKKILADARKKGPKKSRRAPAAQLAPQLVKILERYRKRWNPKELAELAQQLRQFADTLDEQQRDGKKAKKE
jgi:hypothetical protein